MILLLSIGFVALAQALGSPLAEKRSEPPAQILMPERVSYIAGEAQRDGFAFRFVGIERPTVPLAASTESADPGDMRQRLIGPLAVSEVNEAVEAWSVAVRVTVAQVEGLPLLERRDGGACGATSQRNAPNARAESPAERATESEEIVFAELQQAAVFAAGLHDRAIFGLALASAIAALSSGENDRDRDIAAGQLASLQRAASAWLAQHEPQQSIATLVPLDAMSLVATVEYWDARQALLGALSKPKDSALARETLRWYLKRLGATRLLGLLDERVPLAGTGLSALTACPSWPHDAWEIVEAESRLRGERDELRAKLRGATEGAARRLDGEYAAMLHKAMGFVEESLPPGLQADPQLLWEIEEHLSRALDEDTVVRAGMDPGDVALTRNRGNAELTTRAWEVWGRLLATGGLPPAEAARRQSQIDGWYEMAAEMAMRWDTTGRGVQDGLESTAGAFATLMSDGWSGWAFRAMPESVYEGAMRKARGSLSLALEGTHSGDVNGLRDALRISAWETHLELQRVGLGGGALQSLTPFPKERTLDAGHGMAVSNAPARRRLMLDPYGMHPPARRTAPR
jgi:hypothetical protein